MDESLKSIGIRVSQSFATLDHKATGLLREAVRNESERFDLWTNNLGLLQSGHSSLDYRFRDAPLLYNFAQKLLCDVERYLFISKSTTSTQDKGPLTSGDQNR